MSATLRSQVANFSPWITVYEASLGAPVVENAIEGTGWIRSVYLDGLALDAAFLQVFDKENPAPGTDAPVLALKVTDSDRLLYTFVGDEGFPINVAFGYCLTDAVKGSTLTDAERKALFVFDQ